MTTPPQPRCPPELVAVTVVEAYSLRLTYADGVTGIVDTASHLWGPAFQPLHDPAYFARVQLRDGTTTWPNGADFAPEMLYREALRNQVRAFHIDADLHMEDDIGRNIGRLPQGQPWLVPGVVATAGRPGAWSWVVVDEVDDGFVYFHQVSAREAERLRARDDASRGDDDG